MNVGDILGLLSGYALQSSNKIAKRIASIYIWIIRGTPLVVQALYIYFAFPEIMKLIIGSNFTFELWY